MRARFLALAWFLLPLAAAAALHPVEPAGSAEALRQRHEALGARLERNAFGKPIDIASREGEREVSGHIHAVIPHPFARVAGALQQPAEWCSILILPINTKGCAAAADGRGLSVFVGRKAGTRPEDAFRLDFGFAVAQRSEQYLRVELHAARGPLGTRDYHIVLEAAPLDGGRSFLHLAYDTGYGTVTRMAMQAYLATVGADKVGFSTVPEPRGRASEVRGMRGVVERNTMRYYLAIEAYLDSLDDPPAERDRRRLADWFRATERYPRQLREMTLEEYLALKMREVRRMRGAAGPYPGA